MTALAVLAAFTIGAAVGYRLGYRAARDDQQARVELARVVDRHHTERAKALHPSSLPPRNVVPLRPPRSGSGLPPLSS